MMLRFLGYVFLSLAIAALAYDGTRMIADNGRLVFTSLEQHWLNINPASMEAAKTAVDGVSGVLWPLITTVLLLPAWMVSAGLGTMLYLAGYRRPKPAIPDGI
jgi:hypothetical protein